MSAEGFFAAEAADCLRELRALLEDGAEAAELRAPARRLRGSAQMASRTQAIRAASAIERAVRAAQAGELYWNGRAREELGHALDDLERAVEGDGATAADAVVERVAALGAGESPERRRAEADGSDGAFEAFVRAEVARIREALADAAAGGGPEPPSRPSLHAILDVQASLAGSARLGEVPAVALAIEAADHVTRALLAGTAARDRWADAYRDIAAVLADDRVHDDPAPADLAERIGAAREAVAGGDAGERDIPVEVANFFRVEARSELARAEQLARDAAEGRIATARERLSAALEGLATTAATFGFADVARLLEREMRDVADLAAAHLPRAIGDLRGEVLAALGEPARDLRASAAEPSRGSAPAPIVTAGAADEDDGPGDARRPPDGEAEGGPPPPDADGAVPIAALCYAGRDALDRAASLRAEWEAAEGDAARRLIEEVFDLIELGRA